MFLVKNSESLARTEGRVHETKDKIPVFRYQRCLRYYIDLLRGCRPPRICEEVDSDVRKNQLPSRNCRGGVHPVALLSR